MAASQDGDSDGRQGDEQGGDDAGAGDGEPAEIVDKPFRQPGGLDATRGGRSRGDGWRGRARQRLADVGAQLDGPGIRHGHGIRGVIPSFHRSGDIDGVTGFDEWQEVQRVVEQDDQADRRSVIEPETDLRERSHQASDSHGSTRDCGQVRQVGIRDTGRQRCAAVPDLAVARVRAPGRA